MQVANTSNGPKWQRMSIEWFCVVCCFCCVASVVKSVVSVLLFIGDIFYGFPRLISYRSFFCPYSEDMHTRVPAILHQPKVWSHTCLVARLWSHHKHKFPYNRKSGIIRHAERSRNPFQLKKGLHIKRCEHKLDKIFKRYAQGHCDQSLLTSKRLLSLHLSHLLASTQTVWLRTVGVYKAVQRRPSH